MIRSSSPATSSGILTSSARTFSSISRGVRQPLSATETAGWRSTQASASRGRVVSEVGRDAP